MTYLFYDIETTGLSKTFDQVLHFAAVRTDRDLNELKRYELKVKLNPDVVPAPRAVLTHGISIAEMQDGLPEYEAMQQIHQWFNEPKTISLGYNTLGFDDEFLRFSFYRNLLSPYQHQYKNQCGRMDIYPLALFYYLYKNEVLHWPNIENKMSFKLAHLNEANSLAEGPAHHAMADVLATLSLARCFFQERPMWDYLTAHFDKKIDQARNALIQNDFGIMVDGRLRDQHYQCPVLYLGQHHFYKNQALFLRLDKESLCDTQLSTIAETTQIIAKKWGEPNFILPAKTRFLDKMPDEQIHLSKKQKAWGLQNPALISAIYEHYANYQYPIVEKTDASGRLYLNGFWNDAEALFCHQFHRAPQALKAELVAGCQSPLLKTLGLRVLGRHWPDALSALQRQQFADYLDTSENGTSGMVDFQGTPRLDRKAALEEIAVLRREGLDEKGQGLLDGLENYLSRSSNINIASPLAGALLNKSTIKQ